MIEEIWKPIPVFNGEYEASNLGRLRYYRRRENPLIKRIFNGPTGYSCVEIKRKTYKVHRLVLQAFNGECPCGYCGGHLNGNPLDNRLENLAWITLKENQAHRKIHGTEIKGSQCHRAVLNEEKVAQIKALIRANENNRAIGRKFNVVHGVISKIRRNKTWRHVQNGEAK